MTEQRELGLGRKVGANKEQLQAALKVGGPTITHERRD